MFKYLLVEGTGTNKNPQSPGRQRSEASPEEAGERWSTGAGTCPGQGQGALGQEGRRLIQTQACVSGKGRVGVFSNGYYF